jgi:hypothetical protein
MRNQALDDVFRGSDAIAAGALSPARLRGADFQRRPGDVEPWAFGLIATPPRLALDLLLGRPVPDAVADLDAVWAPAWWTGRTSPRSWPVGPTTASSRPDGPSSWPIRARSVEYDGDWRDGELWALNRDRDRLNRVHALGWDVVFVTAPLLRDPRRMVRTVRQALA